MCTAKGRLIASFLIWREGADYLLQLSADILPAIHKKLSMYVLRSKVKLIDASDERVLIGVAGAQAEALVSGLGAETRRGHEHVRLSTAAPPMRLDERRFVLAVDAGCGRSGLGQARGGRQAGRTGGLAAQRDRRRPAAHRRRDAGSLHAADGQLRTAGRRRRQFPEGLLSRARKSSPAPNTSARSSVACTAPASTAPSPPAPMSSPPRPAPQHCGALVNVSRPQPEGGYECLLVVQSSGMEAGEVHVGSPDGPKVAFLPLPYAIE